MFKKVIDYLNDLFFSKNHEFTWPELEECRRILKEGPTVRLDLISTRLTISKWKKLSELVKDNSTDTKGRRWYLGYSVNGKVSTMNELVSVRAYKVKRNLAVTLALLHFQEDSDSRVCIMQTTRNSIPVNLMVCDPSISKAMEMAKANAASIKITRIRGWRGKIAICEW